MTQTELPGMPEPQAPAPVEPALGTAPCTACQDGTHGRHHYGCTCTCHAEQVWVPVSWRLELSGYVETVGLARKYANEYKSVDTANGSYGRLEAFLNESLAEVEDALWDIDTDPQLVRDDTWATPEWDFTIHADALERFRELVPTTDDEEEE